MWYFGAEKERRTRRVIIEVDGNTRGRKDRLRGQIGVNTRALRDGCTIGPPADREYAVDPVGVDTMSPSDYESESAYEAGAMEQLKDPQQLL